MSKVHPKMMSTSVRLERLELKRVKERTARLIATLEEAMDAESPLGYDNFNPSMDICENKSAVRILVEVPGVEPEDLNVTISASEFVIDGEKRHTFRDSTTGSSHYCCERTYGKFRRRVQLTWAIDVRGVTAKLVNGTLRVHLPKLEDRRGQRVKIPIQTEE